MNGSASPARLAFAPPESAYIHIPFCRHRCGYCNFSVLAGRDDLIDRFLAALRHEWSACQPTKLRTLFIGGGTPTHVGGGKLASLLANLRHTFDMGVDAEVTIEANPEDISEQLLRQIAEAGVNRISLGVQSFHAAKIKGLERHHTGQQAIDAIHQAADFIGNVSIDLIFAAPQETLLQWREDLLTALATPVRHLSTYALTIEKGTTFYNRSLRGRLDTPEESCEVEMYELTRELTAQAGWRHYEISSFAKPDHRCRHNLAYWRGDSWLAFGPGASRFVDGIRSTNHRSPTTYLRRIEAGQSAVAETESLSAIDYARELAAFGVRMIDGVPFDQIRQRSGVDVRRLCEGSLRDCREHGWIVDDNDQLKLTEQGILFADAVARELIVGS